MKHLLFAITLIFFSSGLFSQQLNNPGFETNSLSGGQGWSAKGKSFHTFQFDKSVKKSGQASLKIIGKNSKPAEVAFLDQAITFKLTKPGKYRFSVFIKGSDVMQTGFLLSIIKDKIPFYSNAKVAWYINGSFDWKEHTMEIAVPAGDVVMHVGGWLAGAGTVWFDDFSLREVKSQGDISPEALQYFNAAVDSIKKYAVFSDRIEGQKTLADAQILLAGATKTEDTYTAIRYVLGSLKDGRSALWSKGLTERQVEADTTLHRFPTGKIIENDIAYLMLPGKTASEASDKAYGDTLLSIVKRLDSKRLKGWIVDLRNTYEGRAIPMLYGIGPLVGDGMCGFLYRKEDTMAIFYDKGSVGAFEDGKRYDAMKQQGDVYLLKNQVPKAILQSNLTGAPGESVAVAFKALPYTRSFGQSTNGMILPVKTIQLPDGAQLRISMAILGDRLHNTYYGTIDPDVETPLSYNEKDATLKAAVSWLKKPSSKK